MSSTDRPQKEFGVPHEHSMHLLPHNIYCILLKYNAPPYRICERRDRCDCTTDSTEHAAIAIRTVSEHAKPELRHAEDGAPQQVERDTDDDSRQEVIDRGDDGSPGVDGQQRK